jgi:DNA-binding CsgD family transcriptional regulator
MEFGYWQRNAFGLLEYTSLSKNLSIPIIEDEHFWNILNLDNWILFQSLNRIVIYNTRDSSFETINSETTLTKIFKVDETIYFQKINDGIYKIENGTEKLVTSNQLIQENIVVNISKIDDRLLLLTQEKGFFILENGNLTLWDIPANEFLFKASVYSCIQLKDKTFALGTISNGIVQLSPNGDINYQINQPKGLANNTVLSLFEDIDHNIWLGLDNGINCVNTSSPLSIFNNEKGEIGTVYTSAIKDEYLYLGTNQGLFSKKINTKDDFKFIEGTKGQVWCLVNIYDNLFCGHNTGTFIINNNIAEKISDVLGVWNLKPIEENENLILQGNYNGLNILEKKNNKWYFKNKIEGFNISSRYFERLNQNEIFVSHEYKGVFKIKVNDDFTEAIEVSKDSSVVKGLNSSLVKYNQDLLYTYKDGVFKFNEATNSFKKDTLYSNIFKNQEYTSGKLISDSETNSLWGFSDKGLNYFSPGKLSSTPKINRISLLPSLSKGMTGYENIMHYENQKYLFSTTTGYVIIDLDKLQNKNYNITINTISKNDINSPLELINKNEPKSFKNNENNISFSYSVPEFDKYSEAEYQYQLVGLYNQWSNWSTRASKTFNNLPHGDYTFNVRARVSNNLSSNIASYKFNIAKPWYLGNIMITLYILCFLIFSFIIHNFYKRFYKRQREKLLEQSERELELRKLENEQQLMSFENEKLQQDIENKNRELAISTMSLIKKNEFLNSIKKEIKNSSDNPNLKTIVKIIDKNLNNTDDWKFFQEAFNNADKDFLKKIKAVHPSLTPNDLRLCAYLRLNLSSKEIAPLLNISLRSVEVKRYRLRKKMNLQHEKSLTNYILEL